MTNFEVRKSEKSYVSATFKYIYLCFSPELLSVAYRKSALKLSKVKPSTRLLRRGKRSGREERGEQERGESDMFTLLILLRLLGLFFVMFVGGRICHVMTSNESLAN